MGTIFTWLTLQLTGVQAWWKGLGIAATIIKWGLIVGAVAAAFASGVAVLNAHDARVASDARAAATAQCQLSVIDGENKVLTEYDARAKAALKQYQDAAADAETRAGQAEQLNVTLAPTVASLSPNVCWPASLIAKKFWGAK